MAEKPLNLKDSGKRGGRNSTSADAAPSSLSQPQGQLRTEQLAGPGTTWSCPTSVIPCGPQSFSTEEPQLGKNLLYEVTESFFPPVHCPQRK